jgi:hypothetical protein
VSTYFLHARYMTWPHFYTALTSGITDKLRAPRYVTNSTTYSHVKNEYEYFTARLCYWRVWCSTFIKRRLCNRVPAATERHAPYLSGHTLTNSLMTWSYRESGYNSTTAIHDVINNVDCMRLLVHWSPMMS